MLQTSLRDLRSRAPQFSNIPRKHLVRSTPRTLTRRTISSRTLPPKSKPSTTFTFSSHPRPTSQNLFQRLIRQFHAPRTARNAKPTPGANPSIGPAVEAEPLTLGARMRKLSREYGWSAVGVYFTLSALDFPFCYMFVKVLGTDRIGHWEHVVVSYVATLIPRSVKDAWHDWRATVKKSEKDITGDHDISEGAEMVGWGVEEAEERNRSEASLGTQLALAYAIHKSFIFLRVPLAAAITPKVVKTLRGWGWDIGKRTTKEAKAIKRAALPQKPSKN